MIFDIEDAPSLGDIIGKRRTYLLYISFFLLYLITYSILIYLNFESVSELISGIQIEDGEIASLIPGAISICLAILSVIIYHTLVQSYIDGISIPDSFAKIVFSSFIFILMGGFMIFIPMAFILFFILGIPLQLFLPQDPAINISIAVTTVVSFMLMGFALITNSYVALDDDTIAHIQKLLDENDRTENNLDTARTLIRRNWTGEDLLNSNDDSEPKEALESLLSAKECLTSSSGGLKQPEADQLRTPAISNKRSVLKTRYNKQRIDLYNKALTSAESYYNSDEYIKSYNMLVFAKSIETGLGIETSEITNPKKISVQDIASALESQYKGLEEDVFQQIGEAEQLVYDAKYDEAIKKLDVASDIVDKYEEIGELSIIKRESELNPDRTDALKKQVQCLDELAANIESIEWTEEIISHPNDSSNIGDLFEPVTEIAQMSYADQYTDIAINEVITFCERCVSAGEFEVARSGYQVALKAANTIQDTESRKTVETKLKSLRIKQATEQFLDREDYIRDNILVGEAKIEQGEYNKALRQFRDADESLPPKLIDDVGGTRRALQQRVNEGLFTARQRLLSEIFTSNDELLESHLNQVFVQTGISLDRDIISALPKGSAFDRLVQKLRSVAEQLEFNYSLRRRIRDTQTSYDGHIESADRHINESIVPIDNDQTLASRDTIDAYLTTIVKIGNAVSIANNIIEHIKSTDNRTDEIVDLVNGEQMSVARRTRENPLSIITRMDNAISRANNTIKTYTKSIEAIGKAYQSTSSEPAQRCLLATEKRLAKASMENLSAKQLDEVQVFVERIAAYDTAAIAFPSLPVGRVLQDISEAIESGEGISVTEFEKEFDRIEKIIGPDLDSVCSEIESFIDTWGDHPSVESRQWSRTVKRTRNGGEFEETLKIYKRIKEISDNTWTIDDLYELNWQQFEYLIASLYTSKGYETQVTKGSRDLGIDVWADNGKRLAIQVKQFNSGNTVGRTVIQQLESVLARENADTVVVVTSSSFANTAIEYAERSEDVELIDGNELVRQLIEYEVQSSPEL